jgi:hypothetical protein
LGKKQRRGIARALTNISDRGGLCGKPPSPRFAPKSAKRLVQPSSRALGRFGSGRQKLSKPKQPTGCQSGERTNPHDCQSSRPRRGRTGSCVLLRVRLSGHHPHDRQPIRKHRRSMASWAQASAIGLSSPRPASDQSLKGQSGRADSLGGRGPKSISPGLAAAVRRRPSSMQTAALCRLLH